MDINTGYENRFYISLPKKQAKSYEIDLGQNNGAYKEELLIRYGDNTLNQMMSKKQQGSNMNMEDIMRMNEQLKPFQERQKDEGGESYGIICEKMENKLESMDDNSDFLSQLENNLNKSLNDMTDEVFKFVKDSYAEFNPELLSKYKHLKLKIKEQKDENANLLKQIDLLLQENTQISDLVGKVFLRLTNLEKKSGIENTENEEEKINQSQIEDEKDSMTESSYKSNENN